MALTLTFLGTSGNVEPRNRRHRRHSAMMITTGRKRVMVDCGLDWRQKVWDLKPHAILVTHAHPDHAWGLEDGAPCPVYATKVCHEGMADYPIAERRVLAPRRARKIQGLKVKAFPVIHSLRAPAAGFRISKSGVTFFYVPDIVAIEEPEAALSGAELYIGDAATLTRPMVRRKGKKLFGHTTVRAQLGWCGKWGVPRAVFTHCGSQIIKGDERRLGAKLRAMARERDVEARFAHDGLEIRLA